MYWKSLRRKWGSFSTLSTYSLPLLTVSEVEAKNILRMEKKRKLEYLKGIYPVVILPFGGFLLNQA